MGERCTIINGFPNFLPFSFAGNCAMRIGASKGHANAKERISGFDEIDSTLREDRDKCFLAVTEPYDQQQPSFIENLAISMKLLRYPRHAIIAFQIA